MSPWHSLPEPIVFFATHQVELAVFMHLVEDKRVTYPELAQAYPTTVDWPLVDVLGKLESRSLIRHIEGHASNAPQFRTYCLTEAGHSVSKRLKKVSMLFPDESKIKNFS